MIWSTPISTLAKEHNITEYSIRKACKHFQVPIPLAGYWNKSKANQERLRKSLPSTYTGETSIVIEPPNPDQKSDELATLKNEIRNTKGLTLRVSDRLTSPDKLISNAKAKLEERASDRWNSGLLHTTSGSLDIKVGKDSISRALRIFDTLIKALRMRGHNVIVEYETFAVLYDQKIRVALREKTTRIQTKQDKNSYTYNEYKPTGILVFQIDPGYRVKEYTDAKVRLEEQLDSIIAKLEVKAEHERAQHLMWAQQQAVREDRDRIEREFNEKKLKELEKFNKLLRDAWRYKQTLVLRDYVSSIESGAAEEDAQLQEYIDWAKRKIEWYDPFVSADDDLLHQVDKDTLTIKTSGQSF
jgi:hypothetical protein